MPGWVGYEPQRLAALRSRAAAAADDLGAIASAEPAAIGALQAVRVARDHLETGLLPLIGRMLGAASLLAWHSHGPTGTLAQLDDDELFDEFGRTIRRLDNALVYYQPDIRGAWAQFIGVVGELTARADADPDVLQRLAGDDGDHVVVNIARVLELSATGLISPRPTEEALQAAAELFAVAATDDQLAARLAELGSETPVIGRLLPLASFPRSLMADITSGVLGRAGTADPIDSLARAAALEAGNEALRALRSDADAALDFLGDREAVRLLLTLHLDLDHVEHVLGLGLGTAVHRDPARLGDGLDALANVVAIADVGGIGSGGARGTAKALGVYLRHLVDVQVGRDIMVSTGTDDPDTAVTTRLGSYEDVQNLMQDIVGDEQAQLTLGLIARAHTTDLVHDAAADLPAGVDGTAASHHIAGSLAPHAELLRMVVDAVADENSDRVAARAALISDVTGPIRTIGTIAGFLPGPLARGASAAANPAADLFEWAMRHDAPDEVPDTGFVELTAMDFTFDVVELVVGDASLRQAYGIDSEARVTLTAYAAGYRMAPDLRTKAALENQVLTYLTAPGQTLGSSLQVIKSESRFVDITEDVRSRHD